MNRLQLDCRLCRKTLSRKTLSTDSRVDWKSLNKHDISVSMVTWVTWQYWMSCYATLQTCILFISIELVNDRWKINSKTKSANNGRRAHVHTPHEHNARRIQLHCIFGTKENQSPFSRFRSMHACWMTFAQLTNVPKKSVLQQWPMMAQWKAHCNFTGRVRKFAVVVIIENKQTNKQTTQARSMYVHANGMIALIDRVLNVVCVCVCVSVSIIPHPSTRTEKWYLKNC